MTDKTATKSEPIPETVAAIDAEVAAIDAERTRLASRRRALTRARPDAEKRELAAADQAAGEALRGLAGANDDALLAAAKKILAGLPVAENDAA